MFKICSFFKDMIYNMLLLQFSSKNLEYEILHTHKKKKKKRLLHTKYIIYNFASVNTKKKKKLYHGVNSPVFSFTCNNHKLMKENQT